MAIGTDKEVFGSDVKKKVKTEGRPKFNRDLIRRLLQAGTPTKRIMKIVGCSSKTVHRSRAELKEQGILKDETDETDLSRVENDFDMECHRAVGIRFSDWLKTKRKNWTRVFNFGRRTWANVWNQPSLILVRDRNNKLGDEICLRFLQTFQEDKARIRNRKKLIRPLFTYLGRQDLNDSYLTMTQSRDPRPIKKIPEISMSGFPQALDKSIEEMRVEFGDEVALLIKTKIVTQARTGNTYEERGIVGLKKGSGHKSYLIFNDVDEFRCLITEKMNEEWNVGWIPVEVRTELYELWKSKSKGEPIFAHSKNALIKLRKRWGTITERNIGVYLNFHDMRKVSVTWLYIMKVPLEIATMLNVGWKDLNTPRDHYLQLRGVMKKSQRERYRQEIPEWFKEGLDEYTKEE